MTKPPKLTYFQRSDFACSHCGANLIKPELVELVDTLRGTVGFPLTISSGYRCSNHPIESMKRSGPGSHNTGLAADILCSGQKARMVLMEVLLLQVGGVGVSQTGEHHRRFIHVDLLEDRLGYLWTY